MTKPRLFSLIVLCLAFITGCVTYTIPIGKTNISGMYNPGRTNLHPEYAVQIQSDTSANLLVRVLRDEVLFSRANRENKLKGGVSIHCRVYSDNKNSQIYDSLTVSREVLFTRNPVIISVIKLKIQPGKRHNVHIWVRDLKRLKGYEGYTEINNNVVNNTHRFYSTLSKIKTETYRETMNFYPWIPDSFSVKVYPVNNFAKVKYVAIHLDKVPLPKPPYVDEKDTLKLVPSKIEKMPAKGYYATKPGFYLFKTDTTDQRGFGLLKTARHFPNVKTSNDLIPPLEYICTKDEFTKLNESKNKKLAVDEFWINSARDYTKAKQLIRVYYNRTKYANIYFTSVMEGWRTDRGMVFVLLGPPEKVYKTSYGEQWVYGANSTYRTITFEFERVNIPYSNNYYMLRRKTDHRSIWRSALKAWRNGSIYNGEEKLISSVYGDSDDIR